MDMLHPTSPASQILDRFGARDASAAAATNYLDGCAGRGIVSGQNMLDAITMGIGDADGRGASLEHDQISTWAKKNWHRMSAQARHVFEMYDRVAFEQQAKGKKGIPSSTAAGMKADMKAYLAKKQGPAGAAHDCVNTSCPGARGSAADDLRSANGTAKPEAKPAALDESTSKAIDRLDVMLKKGGVVSGADMVVAVVKGTGDLDGCAASTEYEQLKNWVTENADRLSPEAKAVFKIYEDVALAQRAKGQSGIPVPTWNHMVHQMNASAASPANASAASPANASAASPANASAASPANASAAGQASSEPAKAESEAKAAKSSAGQPAKSSSAATSSSSAKATTVPGRTAGNILDDLIASGASASSILLAQEIHDTGMQAGKTLENIQNLRKWRETEQQRVDDLRAIKAFVQKHGGDDNKMSAEEVATHFPKFLEENKGLVERHPELASMPTNVSPGFPSGARDRAVNSVQDTLANTILGKWEYTQDPESGRIESTKTGLLSADGVLTLGVVEAELEKHQGNIHKLDSQKELLTMQLQEAVQRKQRVITLATNIADAGHRSQEAIIKNTRA